MCITSVGIGPQCDLQVLKLLIVYVIRPLGSREERQLDELERGISLYGTV